MWKMVLIVVVLAAAGYATYVVLQNRAFASGFESVAKGMTKSQVSDAMGKPDLIREGCRDRPTWVGEPVSETCGSEYQYNERILPAFWTIGFDESGRVIAKYHYVSP